MVDAEPPVFRIPPLDSGKERFVRIKVVTIQNAVLDIVDGASHAFFDWKPDQRTKDTFAKYGVPYAAKMRQFFDEVFY